MSVGPHGSPDWQKLDVRDSEVQLSINQGVAKSTASTYGPVFVGRYEWGHFRLAPQTVPVLVTVRWYLEQGLANQVGSQVLVLDVGASTALGFRMTHRGPWMTVTIDPQARNATWSGFTWSSNRSFENEADTGAIPPVNRSAIVLGAGNTDTIEPLQPLEGPYTISGNATLAGLSLTLQALTSTVVWSTVWVGSPTGTDTLSDNLYLPLSVYRLQITNGAAGAFTYNAHLIGGS